MKKERKNIKPFYQKKTNKIIPNNFEIHHIDLDYTNNDILNLVAIPKKLHQKYHHLYDLIKLDLDILNKSFNSFAIPYNCFLSKIPKVTPLYINIHNIKKIKELNNLGFLISKWCIYRDFLLKIKYEVDIQLLLNKDFIY